MQPIIPTPPVASAALQALLDSFVTLSDEQVAAQAAAEQAAATKNAGIEELVTAMRADIRYAEDAVNYDGAVVAKSFDHSSNGLWHHYAIGREGMCNSGATA